jgi:hypothetical protein
MSTKWPILPSAGAAHDCTQDLVTEKPGSVIHTREPGGAGGAASPRKGNRAGPRTRRPRGLKGFACARPWRAAAGHSNP